MSALFRIFFRITPDPRVFAYSYLEVPGETFNPSMYYVDLPLDVVTSTICGLSYIVVSYF